MINIKIKRQIAKLLISQKENNVKSHFKYGLIFKFQTLFSFYLDKGFHCHLIVTYIDI